MKAMVLAAGLGTRLRPLTNHRPKALVGVGGHTLLEITLARLRQFEVDEVIINVHHFADMMVDYLQANHNFGMKIEVSYEDVLLDTGGGLKKASYFFLGKSTPEDEPFIVHNVDVISTIDLRRMMQAHVENHALATLAVQDRKTKRYLLFDDSLRLCGRQAGRDAEPEAVRAAQHVTPLAFSGIHVVSPRLLSMMTEQGAFSIIETYLRLAAQGEKIQAFRADDYEWLDIGKPENAARAAEQLKSHFTL